MKRMIYGLVPVTLCLMAAPMVFAGAREDPGLMAYQKFNSGPPTTPPAPVERPKPKAPDTDAKARETAAALLAQEEANYFRRLAVCDRLKQLAMELGDTKLEEEAMRLDLRAGEVFRERTRHLTAVKSTKAKTGE